VCSYEIKVCAVLRHLFASRHLVRHITLFLFRCETLGSRGLATATNTFICGTRELTALMNPSSIRVSNHVFTIHATRPSSRRTFILQTDPHSIIPTRSCRTPFNTPLQKTTARPARPQPCRRQINTPCRHPRSANTFMTLLVVLVVFVVGPTCFHALGDISRSECGDVRTNLCSG
jgi:hypothetical protein